MVVIKKEQIRYFHVGNPLSGSLLFETLFTNRGPNCLPCCSASQSSLS